MIKLPVKDRDTIPWMSRREIPAIKAVLSAWRARRRDKEHVQHIHARANEILAPRAVAEVRALELAWDLELIAALDERMRKETKNAKAKA